jgi:hypothetical protein
MSTEFDAVHSLGEVKLYVCRKTCGLTWALSLDLGIKCLRAPHDGLALNVRDICAGIEIFGNPVQFENPLIADSTVGD